MANPFLGALTVVGFGEESTWGTAVSRTVWAEALAVNTERKSTYVPRASLGFPGSTLTRQGSVRTEEIVEGSIELYLTYRSLGIIYKHLMGALSTAAGSPNVHTYTLAALPPSSDPGLTIEVNRGTSGNSEVFEGCVVRSATISMQAGERAKITVDFIGQTSAARSSAGSPTYPAALEVVEPGEFTSLSWNSITDWHLDSFSLSINRQTARRQILGDIATAQPLASDFSEVTLDLSHQYNADTQQVDHHDESSGDAVLTLDGTGNSQIVFTLQNCQIVDYSDTITGPGVIAADMTMRAHGDASDDALKIVVTNDDASGIASS